ncbi:inactive leucine-rich repeat receptor-like serine/threonine-protein kinase At1g60630 [Phalaenopsis equestris]|uniref:inactive leucine-rich repeat receptor-like serine/threonine-protein kinase At1g60630 n=1 Tax=Phalaenopsis equestris TaxID=78828 RepID=UPI0009E4196F|nr:inactive leucine-rich repeat receptor-like serine/threonine-protein kinase At1g60630 [Phalaenopsis equestris]
MGSKLPSFICFVLFLTFPHSTLSGDVEALLSLKTALDAFDRLPWRKESGNELCTRWPGVKQCSPSGRVIKLVLEFLNLTGTLAAESLSPLDQLRVLSFKSNSISGEIPNLSVLPNLKSLYLNDNHFSGQIPASLASIHHLKTIVLSNNRLSGNIPSSFVRLAHLYSLQLQSNRLTGTIPALNQPTLRFLNLSDNNFSGEIPATRAFSHFNESSFLNNHDLCGAQIRRPCPKSQNFPPPPAKKPPFSSSHSRNTKKLAAIIAGSVAGFLLLLICLVLVLFMTFLKKRNAGKSKAIDVAPSTAAAGGGGGGGKAGFSWEGEGLGKLIFVGGVNGLYTLEDLLKASAETLGRGTVGSTYKAVMESGFIVTVKRLTETGPVSPEDFRRRMEDLGRLRHPNLVALRAYFQAREERLLVYDYFPNGSLFSLIHGSRPTGSGKPLHWTSCLKIAEDVATALLYLHQSGAIHGNLKSSNVLLGPDFESCLTDFSLLLHSPNSDHSSSSSLFYRAPECRNTIHCSSFSPPSDIYSFGVLLLELLTGKTPFQDLVDRHGAEIPAWVRAVREEEKEAGASADDSSASIGGDAVGEGKLAALIEIAMACLAGEPEMRPATKEVVRMVREARAEGAASVSSNSSGGGGGRGENNGHSPGRWSDTVQSLPREYGAENLSFAERN